MMINGRRCRIRLTRPAAGLPAGTEISAICSCTPPGVSGWAGWTVIVDGREVDVYVDDAVEVRCLEVYGGTAEGQTEELSG